MKRSKFSEAQIAFILRQAEEGTAIGEVCRKAGISEASRVRYGYRRIHVLLCREGWRVNVKRVRRLYREQGLQLRNKSPKRRVKAKLREDQRPASDRTRPGRWTSYTINWRRERSCAC
jgi:transposase InsO family protein